MLPAPHQIGLEEFPGRSLHMKHPCFQLLFSATFCLAQVLSLFRILRWVRFDASSYDTEGRPTWFWTELFADGGRGTLLLTLDDSLCNSCITCTTAPQTAYECHTAKLIFQESFLSFRGQSMHWLWQWLFSLYRGVVHFEAEHRSRIVVFLQAWHVRPITFL